MNKEQLLKNLGSSFLSGDGEIKVQYEGKELEITGIYCAADKYLIIAEKKEGEL